VTDRAVASRQVSAALWSVDVFPRVNKNKKKLKSSLEGYWSGTSLKELYAKAQN